MEARSLTLFLAIELKIQLFRFRRLSDPTLRELLSGFALAWTYRVPNPREDGETNCAGAGHRVWPFGAVCFYDAVGAAERSC